MNAGHVFPNDPAGSVALNHCKKREGEISPRVSKSRSKAGDGERLTGRSSNNKVKLSIVFPLFELADVSKVGRGEVMGIDGGRKGFNLGMKLAFPSKVFPRLFRRSNATAKGSVFHDGLTFRQIARKVSHADLCAQCSSRGVKFIRRSWIS